jgi:LPPG:FO 2-phospho-L-lactate transferase
MNAFPTHRITALAGGVGASKLLAGLIRVVPPEELTIVVNTGDDLEILGLHVSPDLDIVTYTLAGQVNPATGWGLAGDSFHCLEQVALYGGPTWFRLGDRDLAIHLYRTELLRQGRMLSEVTDQIRLRFGVHCHILPMSNDPVTTRIVTDEGLLHIQEYLVKRRAEPRVEEIRWEGIEKARPAPGVVETILESTAVLLCPSNPLISIGPILAVQGVREALRATSARAIAVSPVVGGRSLKGPTDKMLRDLGWEVSALQVAQFYRDFLDVFVLDRVDEAQKGAIEQLGLEVIVAHTVMQSLEEKIELAKRLVAFLQEPVA